MCTQKVILSNLKIWTPLLYLKSFYNPDIKRYITNCIIAPYESHGKFGCFSKACDQSSLAENVDYGYFSNVHGNCTACRDFCEQDDSCQAVECGDHHCLWWKNDKCNNVRTMGPVSGYLQTCVKDIFVEVKGNLFQGNTL